VVGGASKQDDFDIVVVIVDHDFNIVVARLLTATKTTTKNQQTSIVTARTQ